MTNQPNYIRCEVFDREDVLIASIGVLQIPAVGELLWFGDSLSPKPSAYRITEVAHHVRPQQVHFPTYQEVVIYVEPIGYQERAE